MSTEPIILDFRLSLVWTETLLGLLDGTLQPKPSFEFLALSSSYKQLFETLQQPGAVAALAVPWKESRQHFWNFYLPGSVGKPVGGKQAWEHLVPLRAKPALTVAPSPKGQLTLEGYYYPHGLAVVCTFRCQGSFTPDQVRETAYAIRYDERLAVTADGKPQQLSLNALARKALDSLRAAAVDPGNMIGERRDPISLLTVIKGEGVDAQKPVPEDDQGLVRRMLDVLTYWPSAPETASLTPLADITLTLKRGTAKGSAIFARDRGRTVWFPSLFTLKKQKMPSLTCYHRNNLMGAMQVESLSALVAATAAQLRGGKELKDLTSAHKARARNAADCLERLFRGDKNETYRSDSFKRQISDNDLDALNDLRRALSPGATDLKK